MHGFRYFAPLADRAAAAHPAFGWRTLEQGTGAGGIPAFLVLNPQAL